MRCNPDLQNPYDCEEQTQIQAFIRRSSSLFRAVSPATVKHKARADAFVTNSNVAALNDRFYGMIIECSLALACIRHRLRHAVFLVRCVFERCEHARAFRRRDEFTESERIRKIIWIIFSAINNINSALHLTQTCCIPPERTAAATHLIWITFGSDFEISAINK